MAIFRLIIRNLLRHPFRALLTVGSLLVAFFLLCFLRTMVTTLEAGVEAVGTERLIVQSAVSLFVPLPPSYQAKIEQVPGVAQTSKWHWFGGYYQDVNNQFAQFGVDPDTFLDIYPEFVVVEGSLEAFANNRRGCMVGRGLTKRFGVKLGDTFPLIGLIYPHPDGHDVAWEFEVEAILEVTQPNFDEGSMFFQYEYYRETMEAAGEEIGVGTYVMKLDSGVDSTGVMGSVDALFAGGPQRVQTTSFSEFQAQFVEMLGNIPFFLNAIGGAVLAAILMACVNTMLMAGREQTQEIGILKAQGFPDGWAFSLLGAQSLFLCGLGGAMGIGLAILTGPAIRDTIAAFWPGYHVERSTIILGALLTLAIGVIAGAVPAWTASRLKCVDALGARE